MEKERHRRRGWQAWTLRVPANTCCLSAALLKLPVTRTENERASHCVPIIACIFHLTFPQGVPGPHGNILGFKTISQFFP